MMAETLYESLKQERGLGEPDRSCTQTSNKYYDMLQTQGRHTYAWVIKTCKIWPP
jgi:hypothetical protein